MPHITFTQDVTLDDQPEGTGPHYRRGYSPEVSDAEAAKWIRKGVAELGIVDLKSAEKKPAVSDEQQEDSASDFDIPTFKRKRAKRFE